MCRIDSGQSRAMVPLLHLPMKKIGNMTADSHADIATQDTNLFSGRRSGVCACVLCVCVDVSERTERQSMMCTHDDINAHQFVIVRSEINMKKIKIQFSGNDNLFRQCVLCEWRRSKLQLDKNGEAPFSTRNENEWMNIDRIPPCAHRFFVAHLYLSVFSRSMKLYGAWRWLFFYIHTATLLPRIPDTARDERVQKLHCMERCRVEWNGMRMGRQLYTWFGRLHHFHHLFHKWTQQLWHRNTLLIYTAMCSCGVCACYVPDCWQILRQLCRSVKIFIFVFLLFSPVWRRGGEYGVCVRVRRARHE